MSTLPTIAKAIPFGLSLLKHENYFFKEGPTRSFRARHNFKLEHFGREHSHLFRILTVQNYATNSTGTNHEKSSLNDPFIPL
jgi:hypothetical protein